MKEKTIWELSIESRKRTAAERLAKVAKLKDQGMTGPQIANKLKVKVRTVYQDFAILKREREAE